MKEEGLNDRNKTMANKSVVNGVVQQSIKNVGVRYLTGRINAYTNEGSSIRRPGSREGRAASNLSNKSNKPRPQTASRLSSTTGSQDLVDFTTSRQKVLDDFMMFTSK